MVKANERRYVVRYEAKDFDSAIADIKAASLEFNNLINSSTVLLKQFKTFEQNFRNFKINPVINDASIKKISKSSVKVEAKFQGKEVTAALKKLDSLIIKPTVDLDELHELNEELDRKQEHLKETAELFKNTPLAPKADNKTLKESKKELEGNTKALQNTTSETKKTTEQNKKAVAETKALKVETQGLVKENEKLKNQPTTIKPRPLPSGADSIRRETADKGRVSASKKVKIEAEEEINSAPREQAKAPVAAIVAAPFVEAITKGIVGAGIDALIKNFGTVIQVLGQLKSAAITALQLGFDGSKFLLKRAVDIFVLNNIVLKNITESTRNTANLLEESVGLVKDIKKSLSFGGQIKAGFAQAIGGTYSGRLTNKLLDAFPAIENPVGAYQQFKKDEALSKIRERVAELEKDFQDSGMTPEQARGDNRYAAIGVGGTAGTGGKNTAYIEKVFRKLIGDRKDVLLSGVENPFTDLTKEEVAALEELQKKYGDVASTIGYYVQVLGKFGKVAVNGFNEDAVEVAARAAFAKKTLGLEPRLFGHSAGSNVVEEALNYLQELGVDAKGATLGKPKLAGKGDRRNMDVYNRADPYYWLSVLNEGKFSFGKEGFNIKAHREANLTGNKLIRKIVGDFLFDLEQELEEALKQEAQEQTSDFKSEDIPDPWAAPDPPKKKKAEPPSSGDRRIFRMRPPIDPPSHGEEQGFRRATAECSPCESHEGAKPAGIGRSIGVERVTQQTETPAPTNNNGFGQRLLRGLGFIYQKTNLLTNILAVIEQIRDILLRGFPPAGSGAPDPRRPRPSDFPPQEDEAIASRRPEAPNSPTYSIEPIIDLSPIEALIVEIAQVIDDFASNIEKTLSQLKPNPALNKAIEKLRVRLEKADSQGTELDKIARTIRAIAGEKTEGYSYYDPTDTAIGAAALGGLITNLETETFLQEPKAVKEAAKGFIDTLKQLQDAITSEDFTPELAQKIEDLTGQRVPRTRNPNSVFRDYPGGANAPTLNKILLAIDKINQYLRSQGQPEISIEDAEVLAAGFNNAVLKTGNAVYKANIAGKPVITPDKLASIQRVSEEYRPKILGVSVDATVFIEEFLEGFVDFKEVFKELAKQGNQKAIKELLIKTGQFLKMLHQAGIVHRDFSFNERAGNLMINPQTGQMKAIDFTGKPTDSPEDFEADLKNTITKLIARLTTEIQTGLTPQVIGKLIRQGYKTDNPQENLTFTDVPESLRQLPPQTVDVTATRIPEPLLPSEQVDATEELAQKIAEGKKLIATEEATIKEAKTGLQKRKAVDKALLQIETQEQLYLQEQQKKYGRAGTNKLSGFKRFLDARKQKLNVQLTELNALDSVVADELEASKAVVNTVFKRDTPDVSKAIKKEQLPLFKNIIDFIEIELERLNQIEASVTSQGTKQKLDRLKNTLNKKLQDIEEIIISTNAVEKLTEEELSQFKPQNTTTQSEFQKRLNRRLNRGGSEGGYFRPGAFLPDLSGLGKSIKDLFKGIVDKVKKIKQDIDDRIYQRDLDAPEITVQTPEQFRPEATSGQYQNAPTSQQPRNAQDFEQQWDDFQREGNKFSDRVKTWWQKFLNQPASNGSKATSKLSDYIRNLANTAPAEYQKLVQKIKQAYDEHNQKAAEARQEVDQYAQEIEEFLNNLPDTAQEFADNIPDMAIDGIENLDEALGTLFENASEQAQQDNPLVDFFDQFNETGDATESTINNLREAYDGLRSTLYKINPAFGNLLDLAQNLIVDFGELAAAQQVFEIWGDIEQQAVDLVRQLQNVGRAINTLTQGKGTSSMAALGKISKNTSSDLVGLAEGYKQLIAATKGTSFEPFAMRFMESFASLSSSQGLDEQSKQRALTAWIQVFGKGKLSAEELTGQLAEAAPGMPQTLARGLGLTSEQLMQRVSEGSVSASEAGLAFMRQASSEAGDLSQSYMTLQGSVNRLNNSTFQFKQSLGEAASGEFVIFKNVLAIILDLASQLMPILSIGLASLTVFLAGKGVENIVSLVGSVAGLTKNTAGFARFFGILKGGFGMVLDYIGAWGVASIGVVLLYETWTAATQTLFRGTQQVAEANDSLAASLKKVAEGYQGVKAATQGTGFESTSATTRAIDVVYKAANSFLDFLGGGEEKRKEREAATGQKEFRFTTFGEGEFAQNVINTSSAVDKAYSIDRLTQENLTQEKLNATAKQIQDIDKRKAAAEVALNYALRNKNQADIDKYKAEINDLEQQKQQAIDEINTYQGQVENTRTQIKNLLNYWKDLANNPNLTNSQQEQAQAQVKLLEKALDDVGKTADKGKAAITGLAKAIGDLGLQLSLVNAKFQNFEYNLNLTSQQQKTSIQQDLASNNITSAQSQRLTSKADVSTAEQRITQLNSFNQEYQKIYQSLDQKNQARLQSALLKPLSEAGIGDIERIVSDQTIYDALDINAKAALEARKKFLEGQTQIAQSQGEVASAQASLNESLKDFSRSYREFLLNAKRQLEDLQLQTERELLNYKYQLEGQRNKLADLGLNNALESFRLELKKTIYQITTKTRGTVSTTFDGLLSALSGGVETAYENLRIDIQLKDTLNGFLQAIEEGLLSLTEQINQFNRSQEDRLQAARDLMLSNPTGTTAPGAAAGGAIRWIEGSSDSSAGGAGHLGDDIFAPIGSRIFSPVAGTIVQSREGGTKNTDDADPKTPGYQPQQLIILKLDMPITFEGKRIEYLNMRHLLSRNENLKVGSKVNVGDFLGTVGEAGGSGTQFGSKNPGTAKDADASHLHIEYSPGENDQRNSLTDTQASRLTRQLSQNYQSQVSSSASSNTSNSGGISLSGDKKRDFLTILEAARLAGDPHPEVTAAQWALESAWGTSQSGKYNYFGIKATSGQAGSNRRTWEVIGGRNITTSAKFRDYGSLQEGVSDRVDFVQRNQRYVRAGYNTAQTPREGIQALKNAGYATDPNYVGKIVSIMQQMGINPDARSSGGGQINVPTLGQNLSEEQAAALADWGRSNNLITEADATRIANLRQHTAQTIELYRQQAQAETQLAQTRKESNRIANATELAKQRKDIDQKLKDDQLTIDREKQRFATQARGYTQLQTSVRDYADQLDSLRQTQKEEEINFTRQADFKRSELLGAQESLADTEEQIAKAKELNASAEQLNELQQTRKRLIEVIIPLIKQQIIDNEKLIEQSKENLELGEAYTQRQKAKGIIADIKAINSTIDSIEDLKVNYGLLDKATADYNKGKRDLTENFASQKIDVDEAIEKAKILKEEFEKANNTEGVEKMNSAIKALTEVQSELNKLLEKGNEALELNRSATKKTERATEITSLNKYRSQLDQLYTADMTPIDAAKYNQRNALIENQSWYLEESANIDRLAASTNYGSEKIQQMRSDLEELNQVKLGQINNEADYLMVKLKEIAVSGISGVLNGFYDWIRGTKDLGEAFREVAISILDQIAQIALQIAVSGITGALFGTAQGKGGTTIKSSGGPSPWMQLALSAASSFAGGFAKGGAIGETWTSWGGSKNWGSFETPLNKITPPVVLPIQPPPLPLPIPFLPQIPIFSLLSFAKGGNIGDAIANEKKYGKKPMLAVVHKGEQVLSTLDGEAQQYRRLQQILGDSPLSKIKMSFATGGDLLDALPLPYRPNIDLRSALPQPKTTYNNRQSTININTSVTMPPGSTSALTAQQVASRNAEAARRAVQRD